LSSGVILFDFCWVYGTMSHQEDFMRNNKSTLEMLAAIEILSRRVDCGPGERAEAERSNMLQQADGIIQKNKQFIKEQCHGLYVRIFSPKRFLKNHYRQIDSGEVDPNCSGVVFSGTSPYSFRDLGNGRFEIVENPHVTSKPNAPKGRAWTDTRRDAVQKLAQKTDLFRDARLTADQINFLYDVVVDEHEGWDGEEVEPKHVVSLMVGRYTSVGLIPSRN
jgi:hypothetical protein